MIEIITKNSGIVETFCVLMGMSLSLRLLLQFCGQKWIETTAHTATLVLLPILTFVITKVIAGNIALSLGMVGALSIVRFRNPVRSPLELSVYFAAITMGIAAAVSLKWLLCLGGAIAAVVIVLLTAQLLSRTFLKTSFFSTSFSEGTALCVLEVSAAEKIIELEESALLNRKTLAGGEHGYTLVSANFSDLRQISELIQDRSEIKTIQLNRS